MALYIVWDEGVDTHCHPGSVLSGNVRLSAARQQSVGQVAITFAGRCKVVIERSNGQSRTYHHSKGYYFYQRQQLHQGEFTFQAGTYNWPFRFVMPAYADKGLVQSLNGKGDMFRHNPPWRGTGAEELHPLPATFSGPKRCNVEYYVKAELSQQGLFSLPIKDEVMLNFQPLMAGSSLSPALYTSKRCFPIRTLKLLPEDSEERRSFRHRLKGVFQSSSLPQLDLCVEVTIPRRAVATRGTAFPCLVSVSRSATAVEDPRQVPPSSVILRRFELELRSHTEARVRSLRDHKRDTTVMGMGVGGSIRIQNADLTSEQTKPASGTDHGTAIIETDIGAINRVQMPAGITPDFSTYNIAHYHTITLKLRLECAGESMDCDMRDLKLEITPEPAHQDPPAWQQAPPDNDLIEQYDDMDLPPSYTDQPQHSSK